ncbi:MAG: hypothetical protein NXI30_28320 [bacterium]|nr:hypothetical protein [bacterium]
MQDSMDLLATGSVELMMLTLALDELREGETQEAICSLELILDGELNQAESMLSNDLSDAARESLEGRLEIAREYRARHPKESSGC